MKLVPESQFSILAGLISVECALVSGGGTHGLEPVGDETGRRSFQKFCENKLVLEQGLSLRVFFFFSGPLYCPFTLNTFSDKRHYSGH